MTKQLFRYNLLALVLAANTLIGQSNYATHSQLSARIQTLVASNAANATVKSIGKSRGGRDLWLLTLSKGEAAKKPAILIVAGIDGAHLAGSEIALQMAEKLLASAGADSVAKLLETKTLYIVPSVNPDAQEQFSAKIKFDRSGNDNSTDDDRDGRFNEDSFEDLNADGLITMVRIEDPTGTFITSKEDPRVLVKADAAKGESGKYLLISEGTDNDKDGNHNEDGPGGVNPDKNFTFDYPIFVPGSGEYATSEPEARALLDFLYKQPNIFAVLTFGPNNNLSEPSRFDPARSMQRIIKAPTQKDGAANDQVSKLYNATGLKDAPPMPQSRGNFSQTAYYHAGRFSFSTPGWWVPKVDAPRDTTRRGAAVTAPTTTPGAAPTTGRGGAGAGGVGGAGRFAGMAPAAPTSASTSTTDDDLRFLKWADKEKLPNAFVNWTAIQHPDFPNQKAEVGGIAPYIKLNPPMSYLTDAVAKHAGFVVGLSKQMPVIEIVNSKIEALGIGLSRITVTVINKGLLPTYAEIGDRVRFVQKMKTEIKLGTGQTIVSGRKIILRPSMGAGEKEEYSWLVSGIGSVTIEAGCATTGTKTINLALK